MDREKVSIRIGKAFKINAVTVKKDYIDGGYELFIYQRNERYKTKLQRYYE
jgi:hypothetical protein